MDDRALILPASTQLESDDNPRFVYDGAELQRIAGKPWRKNSFSVDSGHHSPFVSSPFPLPTTRVDGGAYTNPVFVDDYPPTPKLSRNDKNRYTESRADKGRHADSRADYGPSAKSSRQQDRSADYRAAHADYPNTDYGNGADFGRGTFIRKSIDKVRKSFNGRRRIPHERLRDEVYDEPRAKSREKTRDKPRDITDKPRGRSRDRVDSIPLRQSRAKSRDNIKDADWSKNAGHSRKPRLSRSEERRKTPEKRKSRSSERSKLYNKLTDTDSDYQNGDYRSDTSLPPLLLKVPTRQESITTRFSTNARRYLVKRIANSTASPSETGDTSHASAVHSDATDDSVFITDSSLSITDTGYPLEPMVSVRETKIPMQNESPIVAQRAEVTGDAQHFTFDPDALHDVAIMNGDLDDFSPAVSELDEDLPDIITPEDTDDMIVMLLSNRSPCVAKLIAFCGIMQLISGFITMISGASGFLSDITVFDFDFDSPIAFWCGALFVFSGAIGIKTSHTKRRSMNLFALIVSFSAGCSALFVLVMTADPDPIYNCKLERRLLYYFHLFLMNVEIMSSAVLSFMCLKSLLERKSAKPNEVQVLKTLSKYGLKPEHSVPQMAAAKAAAAARASRPGTPNSKTPLSAKTPPRTPNRSRGPSANSSKTDLRIYRTGNNGTPTGTPKIGTPENKRTVNTMVPKALPNGTVIQPPPNLDSLPDDSLSANQRTSSDSANQNTRKSTNERTDKIANGTAPVIR